jgi:hypothetical protein
MGKASESLRRKAIGPFLRVLLKSGSQLRSFGYRLRRFDVLFFQAETLGNEKVRPDFVLRRLFYSRRRKEARDENWKALPSFDAALFFLLLTEQKPIRSEVFVLGIGGIDHEDEHIS